MPKSRLGEAVAFPDSDQYQALTTKQKVDFVRNDAVGHGCAWGRPKATRRSRRWLRTARRQRVKPHGHSETSTVVIGKQRQWFLIWDMLESDDHTGAQSIFTQVPHPVELNA
ncbi:hypothetical protein GCM10027416_18690 [Okibacterium endophyticum]